MRGGSSAGAFWGGLPFEASPSVPLHGVEREGPMGKGQRESERPLLVSPVPGEKNVLGSKAPSTTRALPLL
jgi:hypothetical protein